MQNKYAKFMPWYFPAAAFQSLIAAAALLRVPSEGLSFARLALLGIIGVVFFFGIGLGLYSRRNPTRFERLPAAPIILSSALLSLTFSLILFLLRYLNPERLLPYYERMSPLLWLLFFLALEFTFLLLLLKNGFHPQILSHLRPLRLPTLAAFCLLLSPFLFVSFTKIGITPDTSYWGEPGVAIPGWLFLLALLIGFAAQLISNFQSPKTNSSPITRFSSIIARPSLFILPLALYLAAVLLWLSVPLDTLAGSFYSPISPPTNMPLPYSDAGYYDFTSQSLLIGAGYFGGIPSRPLYVTYLALLHLLFGQNYPAVIAAQVCTLALFPVALYFLAKKLHSPAAGMTAALLAVFREYTGLWIASNTRVANSKTFTTDFPTALALTAICLVVLWWLERRNTRSTLIAGGAFGLMLLFRSQSLLTLPGLFLLVLLVVKLKWAEWLKAGIVFGAAMTLVVLPWLTHNYAAAGKFTFDDPFQMGVLYSQYSFTGIDAGRFNPETDSLGGHIVSFTLEHPGYVANFIASHFLNTEIGGLLALPLIKPFNGFQEPVNLYWVAWNGTLELYNAALVLFYLIVAAVGFGAGWRRMNWLSLIPLVFNAGYALSNAIARFSAWRYNLPADWVFYFYFSIGAIELLGGLSLLFGAHAGRIFPNRDPIEAGLVRFGDFRLRLLLPVLAFVFVGSLPWLAKGLAQPRYASTQAELISRLETSSRGKSEIEVFLSQPNAILTEGRLLYPRMYWKGEGLSSANPWRAYAVEDFPRIGFLLINSGSQNMIFPTKKLLDFKQGADAIVLACISDNDLLIVRVIAFDDISYQSAALSELCPSK